MAKFDTSIYFRFRNAVDSMAVGKETLPLRLRDAIIFQLQPILERNISPQYREAYEKLIHSLDENQSEDEAQELAFLLVHVLDEMSAEYHRLLDAGEAM